MKTKVAYTVSSPDSEDGSVVVFCTHGLEARRIGASRLGFYFDETEYYAKRDKIFDKWAEQEYVPELALIEAGWYVYTPYYNHRLEYDTDQEGWEEAKENGYEDGMYIAEELVPSPSGKDLYLNMQEVEDHAYEIDGFYEASKRFREYVTLHYPEYEVVKWDDQYPSYTKSVKVTFPGCKYGATIRWGNHEDPIEETQLWIAQGDAEAFDEWRSECQK